MSDADSDFEILSSFLSEFRELNAVDLNSVTRPLFCELAQDDEAVQRFTPGDQLRLLSVAFHEEREVNPKLRFAQRAVDVLREHKATFDPRESFEAATHLASDMAKLAYSQSVVAAWKHGEELDLVSASIVASKHDLSDEAAILMEKAELHAAESQSIGASAAQYELTGKSFLAVAVDTITNPKSALSGKDRFQCAVMLFANENLEAVQRDVVEGVILNGLRGGPAVTEPMDGYDRIELALAVALYEESGSNRQNEALQVGDRLVVETAGTNYQQARTLLGRIRAETLDADSENVAKHMDHQLDLLRPAKILLHSIGTKLPPVLAYALHLDVDKDSVAAGIHRLRQQENRDVQPKGGQTPE